MARCSCSRTSGRRSATARSSSSSTAARSSCTCCSSSSRSSFIRSLATMWRRRCRSFKRWRCASRWGITPSASWSPCLSTGSRTERCRSRTFSATLRTTGSWAALSCASPSMRRPRTPRLS
eukprot:Amastigsp_a339376_1065.p3 type:complete len:121 gc:universal Amastigsp_a339376_1065:721-359(-)